MNSLAPAVAAGLTLFAAGAIAQTVAIAGDAPAVERIAGAAVTIQAIERAMPAYPATALRMGITGGRALLRYTVLPNGGVADVEVLAEHPRNTFARSSRRAVEAWRFAPSEARARREVEFVYMVLAE